MNVKNSRRGFRVIYSGKDIAKIVKVLSFADRKEVYR